MLDDDDTTRIVGSKENDIALGDRKHRCSGGIGAIQAIPILGGVPVARVVPGILGLEPMADDESVARETTGIGNGEPECKGRLRPAVHTKS